MRKTHRLHIRTSKEVYDRLKQRAYANATDNLSIEARLILEKALGVKRAVKHGVAKEA
jgi:hypothetical protein